LSGADQKRMSAPAEAGFDKTFPAMVAEYQEGKGTWEEEAEYQSFKQHLVGRPRRAGQA
jgi:hypothetical protein